MRRLNPIVFLVVCAAAGPFVFGQTSLSLSPVQMASALAPGKSANHILTIGNDSQETIRIQSEVETWRMGTIGIDVFPAEGAAGLNCREWIRIDEPEFTLQAGEQKDIRITLSAPGDAEPGQYTAAISFKTVSEGAAGDSSGGIRIQGKLTALAMVTVGKPPDGGTVEDLTVEKKDGRDVLILRLKNGGRFFLPTEGKFEIRNEKGKKVYSADILEDPVPPLSERIFSIPFEKKLPPGNYQAECFLRLPTGKTAALKKPIVMD
jgi:hypothetical protein